MINIERYIHDLKFQDGIWKAFDIDKISYPNHGNNSFYEIEDQSFWFKYRNKMIHEVINNYSIIGPIFDVGGGNGFVTNYINNLGFETILVEPSIDGCLNGKARGVKNIINSNFNSTYFYPNNIPNIGLFDVLEHIENQGKFLKELHTNMIPDGRLIITVPAFKLLWSEEDNQAGHYRRYRIKELRKILDDYGFDMLYASYFFSFLVIPIFIFRTIPSKIGIYKISSKLLKNQHRVNSDTSKFLEMIMKFELKAVNRDKSILFGSSLILVARKK